MTPPAALAAMPAPVLHDVTIKSTKKLAQAKVLGVPPEEFGIERGARTIQDCNYCFHEIVTKTVSQLVEEGFDEDQIKGLEDYTGNTEIETLSRDTVAEHYNAGGQSQNESARLVKLTEHYVRMDYEGTGRACIYQVITAGTQGDILYKDGKPAITKFDAFPFAATCPVPQPHRFFGRSIADLVVDIQRIKTALVRGLLDNVYLHSNARVELPEPAIGENTIDDLLVSRPGGIIRTKQPGMMQWQQVSQQSQGLDANALQNQSATAVAQVFSASQMRTKLIARIIAEGVRDVFALLHATIRKHGQQAQTVRLRNQWVDVDPRNWKTRDDMTINVGLGTGGKAQQFAQAMALANVQKELIQGGKAHMVGDDKLYNMAGELTKIMGHKNPDKFFDDPSAKDPQTGQLLHPPAPPPPDPKVLAIQEQSKADQAEIAMKAQLDKQKAQDAAALAQVKAEFDAKIKLLETQMKALEVERKSRADQQAHHAKMTETAVDLVATAHKHDMQMAHDQQTHELKLEQAQQAHQAKVQQMNNKPKGDGK